MLSDGDIAKLLTLINSHHGNAQWDELQFKNFKRELNPKNSVEDVQQAVARFYSNNPGRWMSVGDVNLFCRKLREQRLPSEALIGELAAQAKPANTEQYLQYRRTLIDAIGTSRLPISQAHQKAIEEMKHPKQIQSKPTARTIRHRGIARLSNILPPPPTGEGQCRQG
ncbi:hypothetical protein IHV04_07765 [Bifidobacterium dentium]|uniref:hypothetical protein n=1 Tax=Bifidobacterium dentium TaxID=1689 RepID=UPI0018C2653A|nr:hypothetical protein [Bifidobacterium dentium]MBF9702497.1 hypothetical protein [Bifidobacterium dentium]